MRVHRQQRTRSDQTQKRHTRNQKIDRSLSSREIQRPTVTVLTENQEEEEVPNTNKNTNTNKRKQTIPPKTKPLTTKSPRRNPPKTLEEGLTYVFSTIAELTDDDTAEYIAGMLVKDHSDDDTREFVRGILKEAMPNARGGAVVCDRLFG